MLEYILGLTTGLMLVAPVAFVAYQKGWMVGHHSATLDAINLVQNLTKSKTNA